MFYLLQKQNSSPFPTTLHEKQIKTPPKENSQTNIHTNKTLSRKPKTTQQKTNKHPTTNKQNTHKITFIPTHTHTQQQQQQQQI